MPNGIVLRLVLDGSVRTLHTEAPCTLHIGRDEGAEISIPRHEVSRRHAVVRVHERATVEDLKSANGTYLLGDPVEDAREWPWGMPLRIGPAWLIALREAHGDAASVVGYGPLENALTEELANRKEGHVVGVCRIQTKTVRASQPVPSENASARASWTDVVRAFLRPGDILGLVDEAHVLLLLTGRTESHANALAVEMRLALHQFAADASLEMRICPRDGRDPALILGQSSAPRVVHDTLRPEPASAARSEGMRRVYEIADEVAETAASVFLLGETGAGKEVLARHIHERGRPSRPFVAINCAALPEALLESELFGYERGAFTGAATAKPGLLETASTGTLFLDEVGEMPLGTQAKLLRVLEHREVMRLGAVKARHIDVRIVTATHRDILRECRDGRFRADLYYRLNGVTITIPPLRSRKEEIVPLALVFAERASSQMGRLCPLFSPEVIGVMLGYGWPGNVRELRSVVERAVLFARGGTITPEHLPDEVLRPRVSLLPARISNQPAAVLDLSLLTAPPRDLKQPSLPRFALEVPEPPVMLERFSLRESKHSLRDEVQSLEKERIIDALNECAGNQTRAAKQLGITRRMLISRIERYGLPRPRGS